MCRFVSSTFIGPRFFGITSHFIRTLRINKTKIKQNKIRLNARLKIKSRHVTSRHVTSRHMLYLSKQSKLSFVPFGPSCKRACARGVIRYACATRQPVVVRFFSYPEVFEISRQFIRLSRFIGARLITERLREALTFAITV